MELGQYWCVISDININKQEVEAVNRFLIGKGYSVSVQENDYVTYLQNALAPRIKSLTITWLVTEPSNKKIGFLTKLYNKITGGN